MRDYVVFYVNGRRFEIRGDAAFHSLTDFLRGDLELTGTKVVCAEGDCGACTVLVGWPEAGRLRYVTVDACIQFLYQLDARHVVTVEGLRPNRSKNLHPIQQALVDCHGSQCGYCTPGFVMALAGMLECSVGRVSTPDQTQPGTMAGDVLDGCGDPSYGRTAHVRTALTGNLCRCTGYLPILDAAAAIDSSPPLDNLYPSAAIAADLESCAKLPISIDVQGPRPRQFYAPRTLDDALAFKTKHPAAVIVSGGTELGVVRNKQGIEPPTLLSLTHIPGLSDISDNGAVVVIGANVTWTQVEEFAQDAWPEFHRIIVRFGSPQIRNVATLVANIAHGSPIADSLPFLFVMDAELDVVGKAGPRRVKINDFYKGYKIKDLAAHEIITHVRVPKPAENDVLKLYKVSRRNDLDIATFGAAIRIQPMGGIIARADVACSGVAATVVRMPRTEAFLQGKPLSEETFAEAGRRARLEIQPISDVRGARDFRWRLAENIFRKFFFDVADAEAAASEPANGKAL
jgi:xanthine dehydrogenase small subunit